MIHSTPRTPRIAGAGFLAPILDLGFMDLLRAHAVRLKDRHRLRQV